MRARPLTVVQLLPALDAGGVERGAVEIAAALVARGHRALVVSSGGRMVPALTAAGAEHVAWPIGAKHPATVRFVPALRALFAREHVDIVHARSRLPAWLGRIALRTLDAARRPRWITTVHGPYTANRYSEIMASGDAVIAISKFIRDYILAAYPTAAPGRIRLIPRGVDRAAYPYGYAPPAAWRGRWRASLPPQAADCKLLTIPARLTRWKGQEDFIALIGRLVAGGHAVHGLIVGAPHPRKRAFEGELRARVAAQGLSPHITFLGHREDLREILAVSDLACSLTREPEAFGRTTIEALSLGTPVLGYAHGGTGEILGSLYPRGLVRPGDLAAAASVAAGLLVNAPPVPTDHPYTLARMIDATLAVYAEVAGGGQSEKS